MRIVWRGFVPTTTSDGSERLIQETAHIFFFCCFCCRRRLPEPGREGGVVESLEWIRGSVVDRKMKSKYMCIYIVEA